MNLRLQSHYFRENKCQAFSYELLFIIKVEIKLLYFQNIIVYIKCRVGRTVAKNEIWEMKDKMVRRGTVVLGFVELIDFVELIRFCGIN